MTEYDQFMTEWATETRQLLLALPPELRNTWSIERRFRIAFYAWRIKQHGEPVAVAIRQANAAVLELWRLAGIELNEHTYSKLLSNPQYLQRFVRFLSNSGRKQGY